MRGIALLPASLATLLHLAGALVGASVLRTLEGPAAIVFGVVATGALCLFLTLWLQDAFLIAEETRPPEERRPRLIWLPFVFPVLAVTAFLLRDQLALGQVLIPFAVAAYWALIYRAAAALVRAENHVSGGTATFNAITVAWLGLFYFPIGVWFIRPRLERLSARPYRGGAIPEAAA